MPYIGYFSLIKHTDEFILFDTVQFIRHGWIERNRMLKQAGGWQYIQVPLIKENGRDTLIKDIRINNTENWKQRMLAQIQHYRKIAPNYFRVVKLLEDIFSEEYTDIVSLNRRSLQTVCSFLGIEREFPVFSAMDVPVVPATAPDEWALNICLALGADTYINPIGGTEFFCRDKYTAAGVRLFFQQMDITEYGQRRTPFEPGLSILDVLMFCSAEQVNQMLDNFTLI